MKINKNIKIGLILILLGVALYFISGIDQFIRPLTQPILMGSSKGKDVLFFVLFGITLILSTIGDNDKIYNYFKNSKLPNILKNKQFYLKLSLGVLLITSIAGLIVELYLRNILGLNWNTILVVTNPSLTTTSLIHSHLYKSIFATILSSLINYIPAGIHTGSSLSAYTPSIISVLFILIPINYILMILSLQRREFISRIILTFAITLSMIGIIDGGFFGTPLIGGIYLLLLIIFNKNHICEFLNKNVRKNKSTKKVIKKNNTTSTEKFLKLLPHIALVVIIILRFTISIYGAEPDCYELTIYNEKNVDLSQYDVLDIKTEDNKTIAHISNNYNEMNLLNELAIDLKNCDWYSLSWNFYSYL